MTVPLDLSFYPIVIFIHGSGPNDRDETFGPNKPFRDLAHGLARYGIASLRYDKRTFVYRDKSVSKGEVIDLNTEVLQDAKNAIALAESLGKVRDVYVLGHSLGGMMAPKIATENQEIEGIILLAGNARPLEELMLEQYTYLFSTDGITKKEERLLHDLEQQIRNLDFLNANPDTTGLSLPLDLTPAYW